MRCLSYTLLCSVAVFSACNKNKIEPLPAFEANSYSAALHKLAQTAITDSDASIGIYDGRVESFGIKAFVFKGEHWQKIEIMPGIHEFDSINDGAQYFELVEKAVTITKSCSESEATSFLNALRKNQLFTLADDEELTRTATQICGDVYINIKMPDRLPSGLVPVEKYVC